jgi:two-component system, cell cycle sensor histidine kinase PleC
MRPASHRPTEGLLIEERIPHSVAPPAKATFVIDADAGALLEANPAGWTAWGLDAATASAPLPLDRAMPALQRLREACTSQAPCSRQRETLVFWAARGLLRIDCQVEVSQTPAAGHVVRVQALTAVPPIRARAPVLRRHGGSTDLDVALDAWLAHELRTPLSAVIAYAEVLKNEHFGPLSNPRYRSYARDIYDSARHALGVIDSMLRGDKTRSALPSLAFADIDPAGVVEKCLTVARPLAERAGLALGVELAPGLPRIVADELSLRQMLLNLLANAIKFARAGDRVSVAVAYDVDGPLTIAVADTGPGIADAPKSEGTSLGLGLPLTRALAAANGAALAVESAPGRGTRVTISFGKDRVVPV